MKIITAKVFDMNFPQLKIRRKPSKKAIVGCPIMLKGSYKPIGYVHPLTKITKKKNNIFADIIIWDRFLDGFVAGQLSFYSYEMIIKRIRYRHDRKIIASVDRITAVILQVNEIN